jgi:hypothetical protein
MRQAAHIGTVLMLALRLRGRCRQQITSPKRSPSRSIKWRTRSSAPTAGSALCQPAPVRTHFAPVVRQHLSRGALTRKANAAGQRQRLWSQTGLDLFADHPASLDLGSHTAGGDLQRAKSDDRRCVDAQRPSVHVETKPWISGHHLALAACGESQRQ